MSSSVSFISSASSSSTTLSSINSCLIHKSSSFISSNSEPQSPCNNIKNSKTMRDPQKKISINDFHIISELGRGAYGKVVLARSKATDKEYAIKIIDKFFLDKLNKTHEAFIEREMLAKLSHENIVKLVSSFQSTEKLFFILNFYKNGSLEQLINKCGVFTKEIAKFYLSQIVSVLEYFEQKKIAHRDLKPQNIMIDDNYNIKLIDFATATVIGKQYDLRKKRFVPREDDDLEMVGTSEYVSPEMLSRKVENPKSCDLWSLGCIMYQMFHGYTPFKGSCERETINNVIKGEFTMSETIDEDAKDLIKRLLTIDSKERIGMQSIEEIKNHSFFNRIDFDDLFFEHSHLQISKVVKSKSENYLQSDERNTKDSDNILEEVEEEIEDLQAPMEKALESPVSEKTINIIDNYYGEEREEKNDLIYDGIVSYEKKYLFFKKCILVNMKLFIDRIEIYEQSKSKLIDEISISDIKITTQSNHNKLNVLLTNLKSNQELSFSSSVKEGEKWVSLIRRNSS